MKKKVTKLIIWNVLFWVAYVAAIVLLMMFVKWQNNVMRLTYLKNSEAAMGKFKVTTELPKIDGMVGNGAATADIILEKEWVDVYENSKPGEIVKRLYAYQYNIIIHNNKRADLVDWTLYIPLPASSELKDSWNGVYERIDEGIRITPIDVNRTIEGKKSQNVGFQILFYSDKPLYFPKLVLQYKLKSVITDKPVFYLIHFLGLVMLIFDAVRITQFRAAYNYQQKQKQGHIIVLQALRSFANIIDAKDEYTSGHSTRVAYYSREIAKRLGMSEDEQRHIFYIALIHDIGKIGIMDSILKKPGALTTEERAEICKHVTIGGQILKDFTAIPDVADGALYHHERYDGNGYAQGLSGEDIPLVGRIICVADSFDAMASARCYRPAAEMGYIMSELKENAGRQFDPKIADIMMKMIHERVAPVDISSVDLEDLID